MANRARRPNETYADYRADLKAEEAREKTKRHKLLWDSPILKTYVRKRHGELTC